jgi:hypothetical protein
MFVENIMITEYLVRTHLGIRPPFWTILTFPVSAVGRAITASEEMGARWLTSLNINSTSLQNSPTNTPFHLTQFRFKRILHDTREKDYEATGSWSLTFFFKLDLQSKFSSPVLYAYCVYKICWISVDSKGFLHSGLICPVGQLKYSLL